MYLKKAACLNLTQTKSILIKNHSTPLKTEINTKPYYYNISINYENSNY